MGGIITNCDCPISGVRFEGDSWISN
jgi:hypothetical protein